MSHAYFGLSAEFVASIAEVNLISTFYVVQFVCLPSPESQRTNTVARVMLEGSQDPNYLFSVAIVAINNKTC